MTESTFDLAMEAIRWHKKLYGKSPTHILLGYKNLEEISMQQTLFFIDGFKPNFKLMKYLGLTVRAIDTAYHCEVKTFDIKKAS